jgi:hypothetical protein
MSDNTQPTTGKGKKRPDYLAFAVRPQAGGGPKYIRIGVGFTYKNGSIGVMYDATPLSGQIVLLGPDGAKPATLSYGAPTRKPDFEASMVREANGNSFWTEIGVAYRQDGYVSILLDVVPHGKLVLSVPKDNA